jgi:hypothetical protein
MRLCGFDGCERKHRALGYCDSHARQIRKGSDLRSIRLPHDNRKYALDHYYFDEIGDERRAYWLGFITADGCVHRSKGRDILTVELKESDAGHLHMLCQDLGSDRPVLFGRGCARVMFNSVGLVAALGRHGVAPRKSGIVRPWNGPEDLMPHYWRGLLDGDGCISRVKNSRKWIVAMTGSEACVKGFAGWAKPLCDSVAMPRRVVHSQSCWWWSVAGTTKPQVLVGALYRNAAVALDRKRELADRLTSTRFLAQR